mmetsp:Transcript_3274/g.4511  ORF Transcript_3274/g.4511 Transcript_3274/m.4511 type:complete len:511 (-) Transcript_3274:2683-4215(-)
MKAEIGTEDFVLSHRNLCILLIAIVNIIVRYIVSMYTFSGYMKPPLYGDYEAQRHWMEITTNLSVEEWYTGSHPHNDLLYWGLDYPPLTAYFSWLVGKVSSLYDPNSMALYDSRGYLTTDHKLFMRGSVLLFDLLVYFPACYLFIKMYYRKISVQMWGLMLLLLQPCLILIDHGHFQYNNISLGLTIWSIFFIFRDQDILGSVLFCLALNYKQMSLYHAPAFFSFLLGKAISKAPSRKQAFYKIVVLSVTVITTFAVCWSPFLYHGSTCTLAMLRRLFPVTRGIFEDKVANLWCSLSPVVKFKNFSSSTMLSLSTIATVLSLVPSNVNMIIHPTKERFLYCLVNSSFSFFLFSYQVHEKSILLVLLPATLLIGHRPELVLWMLPVAQLSMYPLLVRDGVAAPYFTLGLVFFIACWSFIGTERMEFGRSLDKAKFFLICSMCGVVAIHVLQSCVPPPQQYPDLFPLIVSVYCFLHFLGFFISCNYWQLCVISNLDFMSLRTSSALHRRRTQ